MVVVIYFIYVQRVNHRKQITQERSDDKLREVYATTEIITVRR